MMGMGPSGSSKRRDAASSLQSLDGARLHTIRGLAVVLVVLFHVIGPTPDRGMHLPAGSPLHDMGTSLAFLRLPVLAVVSGFLYGGRRVARGALGAFLRGKSARLLVPSLFALLVFWGIHRAQGDLVPLHRALFFAYEHFWYVQAILLIFLAIGLWDALRRPGWIELLIAAFALNTAANLVPYQPFLSIGGFLQLGPLFLIGMVFRDRIALLGHPDVDRLGGGLVLVYLLGYLANRLYFDQPFPNTALSYVMGGAATSFLLFRYAVRVPGIEMIGRRSLSVYLWHPAAAGAARAVILHVAPGHGLLLFAGMMASGLVVPLLLSLLATNIHIPGRLSSGRSWNPVRAWPGRKIPETGMADGRPAPLKIVPPSSLAA
ncbi:acyltransferase [Sphingomonas sp. AP4-R1]|uniref:acyltransferase family protein n=1 Tax=Sphingomonas sp. AP4-R1 TaxID=2735134 RepID=UPI0014938CBB|nr:acyltransferase [Sphingomonas sp. AP4-R1]QJU57556.1 acyltransferase [Sphingomonas sp. AP4-R1]